MPRTFDLDDSSLVLIIGSGAGGGTLGNELAQKGICTLILEAGPRIEREQHIDDEQQSFAQLTWLDKRTTSGSWEVCQGFSKLSRVDLQSGWRDDGALGRLLAAIPRT
jgi:choline dehydrogenase-like flavoprotein